MKSIFKIARSPTRRLKPRKAGHDVSEIVDRALSERRFQRLPGALEARFHVDTGADSSRTLLQAALAAALVSNVTLLAEWTLTPDVFGLAVLLHVGFVTPCLLALAALVSPNASLRRRETVALAIPAVLGLEVVAVYLMSAAPGRLYYLDLFAVIAILGNTSLPLSSRGSLWQTAVCLGAMALLAHAPGGGVGRQAPIALCAVVTLYAAFQRERSARRAYMLDLRHRLRMAAVGEEARHDPLTGLANRRRLTEVVEKIWAQDAPLVCPISIVLFDVDRFKAYNDLYGHQMGDDCLRRVAACAAQERPDGECVAARYGGEEFILLLPRTSLEEARRVAERLRPAVVALRIPHAGGEELGVVTASFGVAAALTIGLKFADLIAAADGALYEAKGAGRNCVQLAAPGASTSILAA